MSTPNPLSTATHGSVAPGPTAPAATSPNQNLTQADAEIQAGEQAPEKAPPVAAPAFVLRRPTVPPQYYVSAGAWAIDPLKANQFASISAAKSVARTLNISGIHIKFAMTPEEVTAQTAEKLAAKDAYAKLKADRKARRVARVAKRRTPGTQNPDKSGLGMPAVSKQLGGSK